MILLILKMAFLLTVWTLMIKVVTADGMPLQKLREWAEKKAEEGYWVMDGLIICQWCIPNIHGLLFVYPLAFALGILEWFHMEYLAMYPFALGLASFCSGITWNFYLLMNKKSEYYEMGAKNYENSQKYFYLLNKKTKDDKGTQSN